MKKKRLISLMLTGIMVTSVATMAGCSDSNDIKKPEEAYNNKFIVLEDKDGKDILHKGTFYNAFRDVNDGFDFICSDFFLTNRQHSIYDNKPLETEYDEICEECFSK